MSSFELDSGSTGAVILRIEALFHRYFNND